MIEFEHNQAPRGLHGGLRPHVGCHGGFLDTGDARVVVEQRAGGVTRVRVRIGNFGTDDHRRKAKLLLDGIRGRLG